MVVAVAPATGNQAVAPITAITTAHRECGSLWFGSRSLSVTSDHPLYDPVAKGFFPAGDWLLGERTNLLLASSGTTSAVAIDRAERFSRLDRVFDLTVDHEWHTFIAEGVVVHNKSPPPRPCPGPAPDGGVIYSGYECQCPAGQSSYWVCPSGSTAGRCECSAADAGTTDAGARDGG
jgi:hypothetical protein